MKSRRKPSMADADYAIAERLILDDYNRFLTALPRLGEDATDPESFAARHTAARTALAHLQQLQGVVRGEGGEEPAIAGEILGQLDAARAAMASLEKEPEPDDGGAR
ncbi:MAG TPA: hypothetical protein VEX11_14600 [Acetobacteraceae bacterium]|jgi:hypothetical protein|nr:hypothetical protein [Acetobacteraceae bacterium]